MKNPRHPHSAKIESALAGGAASFERRHGELPRGACRVEPVDHRTPFDALAEKEEAELAALGEGSERMDERQLALLPGINGRATIFDELSGQEGRQQAEGEEAMQIALETHFWLLDFLFADGPHPALVMRRLYAWVKKYRPEAVWDMGYRRLADLFGESGAAIEWRVSVLIDDYARQRGVEATKMPWQRTAEACEQYREVQKGNGNRVGGHRSGKHKATQLS